MRLALGNLRKRIVCSIYYCWWSCARALQTCLWISLIEYNGKRMKMATRSKLSICSVYGSGIGARCAVRTRGSLDFLSQITQPLPFRDRISFPYHKNASFLFGWPFFSLGILHLPCTSMCCAFVLIWARLYYCTFHPNWLGAVQWLFYDSPCNVNITSIWNYSLSPCVVCRACISISISSLVGFFFFFFFFISFKNEQCNEVKEIPHLLLCFSTLAAFFP